MRFGLPIGDRPLHWMPALASCQLKGKSVWNTKAAKGKNAQSAFAVFVTFRGFRVPRFSTFTGEDHAAAIEASRGKARSLLSRLSWSFSHRTAPSVSISVCHFLLTSYTHRYYTPLDTLPPGDMPNPGDASRPAPTRRLYAPSTFAPPSPINNKRNQVPPWYPLWFDGSPCWG